MKTKLLQLLRAGAATSALAVLAPSVNAVPMLSLNPSSQTITLGGTASVDLIISGLDLPDYLGGWSVDIVFDQLRLSTPTVTFGTVLGGTQYSALQTAYDFNNNPLYDYFHADETLPQQNPYLTQTSSFTLLTYHFVGNAVGTAVVGFDSGGAFNSLSDELGQSILGFGNGLDVEINVVSAGVPDSAVTLPLALGLGLLLAVRRRLGAAR